MLSLAEPLLLTATLGRQRRICKVCVLALLLIGVVVNSLCGAHVKHAKVKPSPIRMAKGSSDFDLDKEMSTKAGAKKTSDEAPSVSSYKRRIAELEGQIAQAEMAAKIAASEATAAAHQAASVRIVECERQAAEAARDRIVEFERQAAEAGLEAKAAKKATSETIVAHQIAKARIAELESQTVLTEIAKKNASDAIAAHKIAAARITELEAQAAEVEAIRKAASDAIAANEIAKMRIIDLEGQIAQIEATMKATIDIIVVNQTATAIGRITELEARIAEVDAMKEENVAMASFFAVVNATNAQLQDEIARAEAEARRSKEFSLECSRTIAMQIKRIGELENQIAEIEDARDVQLFANARIAQLERQLAEKEEALKAGNSRKVVG